MLATSIAHADDQILALEVTLNGRATQLIAEFMLRDGELYATRDELTSIGVKLPLGSDELLLPLNRFTHDIKLDQTTQKITINVPVEYLETTQLTATTFTSSSLPLSDSGRGLVINYDVLASRTDNLQVLSGLVDSRFYSNAGVLSWSALLYAGNSPVPSVRLDTSFTHADPDTLRRYTIGDLISSGLPWSRPVRLGGAQISTDFNLRPDLVLYPSPNIRGEATVPSNVDLFVNGVRQFSQSVAPGPFEIRQAPIASGAGQIAIAVTDALGRQSFQNVSFYTSGRLLKEGLSSFSVESGLVRKDYGLRSNAYSDAALSSSFRYGYTPALTLEAHGEAMRGLGQAGVGVVANVNNWGVLTTSIAGSSADGHGAQLSAGMERSAGNFSFSISKTRATGGYRDIGAAEGSPVPRSQTTASAGVSLASYGALNLAYTAVDTSAITGFTSDRNPGNDIRVLSLSYFKSLYQRATLFVSAFRQLNAANTSVTVGLVIPFGSRDVIGINGSAGGGNHQVSLQASRPTVSPGDVGWQIQDNEGGFVQRSVEIAYKSIHGRPTAAFSQNGSQTGERIGMRGAVAVADDAVFFTNWIDDSFAVVSAGGMKNIGIFSENRFAGKTDDGGRLLVPDLRSYDVNRIGIDVLDLPLDGDVDTPERMIKPRDRSGVLVRFNTKASASAKVVLTDTAGNVLPVGSNVTIVETGLRAPVGYDGETYLTQLGPINTLQVVLPATAAGTAGKTCRASFKFTAQPNTIPDIGPLACQ
jgi:outer membrane usher protein